MTTVSRLLKDAKAEGFTFEVWYDYECDYEGTNIAEAREALFACDEMELKLIRDDGTLAGWALIVPELALDEQIADCAGWVSDWMDKMLEYY